VNAGGYLLDVNVLIAGTDPGHEFHGRVRAWLRSIRGAALLFCPIVENGFLRIYGSAQYPGGPGSPEGAMPALQALRDLPGVRFIPDDISITDSTLFRSLTQVTSRRLTDAYLLALAVKAVASFATLDRGIGTEAVWAATHAVAVIPEA
jgi:hypothetical protein